MSDQHSNPFVLPGLGQSSELSGNPLLASMEMMRQAWAALAGPGGLAQAVPMAGAHPDELERRIAELRSVENWLRMNLSMLSSTIQGLEVQRATIATLRAFADGAVQAQDGAASPLEIALGLKPAPAAPAAPPKPAESAAGEAGAGEGGAGWSQASQSASQAWWNLLQQQFGQLAAATAASMPQADASASPPPAAAGAAGQAGRAAAPARKRAPRKRAVSRPPTGRAGSD